MFIPTGSVHDSLTDDEKIKFANAKRGKRDRMDGREIVGNYCPNESCRPEAYSGYVAGQGYLGSERLEKIYKGVKEEYGDQVASDYCELIYLIPNLAPTAFLLTFYDFISIIRAKGNWRAMLFNQKNIAHDGLNDGGATAFGTVMTVIGNKDQDPLGATESIRREFLWNHKDEYEKDDTLEHERRKSGYSSYGSNRYGYIGEG